MYYLTNCSIIKNEFPYVLEYYSIHKYLGVEHFLFFDRSTEGPPLKDLFKDHSDVEVIHFPEPNRHALAWLQGRNYYENKTVFTQFIDIDEVVVPMNGKSIPEMLEPFDRIPNLGSVGLNWHTFGSSGREDEPDYTTTSTYEAYTKRSDSNAGINNHIQSICKPQNMVPRVWDDPHGGPVKPGFIQVNESQARSNGPFNIPPTQNVGFIAHYYTRSRAYWQKKISKMRADTGTSGGTMEDFDHHQLYMNAVEDLTVKNIWDKAKLIK